jgi:hypothetical protein
MCNPCATRAENLAAKNCAFDLYRMVEDREMCPDDHMACPIFALPIEASEN